MTRIVLDLPNPLRFADLLDSFAQTGGTSFNLAALQIREQTAPPRIEEPGLWGVVEASSAVSSRYRTEFVHRIETPNSHHWARIGDGDVFEWHELIDPTLIRAGVES